MGVPRRRLKRIELRKKDVKLSDLCRRYRIICSAQRRTLQFALRSQVLSGLQHRGVFKMCDPRGSGRSRASEATVELSVVCDAVHKQIVKALPTLEHYVPKFI